MLYSVIGLVAFLLDHFLRRRTLRIYQSKVGHETATRCAAVQVDFLLPPPRPPPTTAPPIPQRLGVQVIPSQRNWRSAARNLKGLYKITCPKPFLEKSLINRNKKALGELAAEYLRGYVTRFISYPFCLRDALFLSEANTRVSTLFVLT